MDKLFDQKIPLALWSIIDDMYSGLTTRVKWKGDDSFFYVYFYFFYPRPSHT
jgi:hypothetical protein